VAQVGDLTRSLRDLSRARGSNPELSSAAANLATRLLDLTCQHKNHTVLVEGPEITIKPVGTRRVSAGEADACDR
jgi:hypothetical protein